MKIGNWVIEKYKKKDKKDKSCYYVYRKWDYPDSDARYIDSSIIKCLIWCIKRE